jgi:hypothetical protein
MTRFLFLLVVVLSAFAPSTVAAQSEWQSLQVRVVRANVRDAASMKGGVIFQASENDVLTVLNTSGDWYFVESSTGRRGYINKTVVRQVTPLAPDIATPTIQLETTNSVALRNVDVIMMTHSGLSTAVIIAAIQDAKSTQFDLSPAGLVDLKNSRVSDEVIRFMVESKTPLSAQPLQAKEDASADAPQPIGQPRADIQSSPNVRQETAPQVSRPTTRRLGFGGRVGGFTLGLGGSIRYWSNDRLGFQIGVSRFSLGTSDLDFGISANASVLQIAPTVVYRFGEPTHSDDITFQPYAGGGINIFRSSISATAAGLGQRFTESQSATNFGVQGFGGVEIFFDEMSRLSVSSDVGYYSTGVPFTGFRVGGLALGFAGHWYVR